METRGRKSDVGGQRCPFTEIGADLKRVEENSRRRRFHLVTQRENGDESKFFDEAE